ncbi:MAG: HD domain-containing protein [Bryobacteraceae bacterium]|nr:HD domain-containing protein [Bryobacteraceae bacterium]
MIRSERESQNRSSNDSAAPTIRLAEVISSLSFALDLTEGQAMGHSVRACIIAMHIGEEIRLTPEELGDLYYASLMKDAGCSTNSSRMYQILGTDDIKAKRDVKVTDWTRLNWESLSYAISHVQTGAPFLERVRAIVDVAQNQKRTAKELVTMRCERGSFIARRIGLSENSASAIHSLDELWSGAGQPTGLCREEIPVLSRVMNLSQNLEVFYSTFGPVAALEMARVRSGRWFDPSLVAAFESISKRGKVWDDVDHSSDRIAGMEPTEQHLVADPDTLDSICLAFADVIDAKSPFTFRHSTGVAGAAVAIARTLELSEQEVTTIRRAALLHDIGKLSVPNSILDKPGKLTNDEWQVVKKHPYYSFEILKKVPGFTEISEIAASHHEKLDGSGYFRGQDGDQMPLSARILVVADIYDALAAKRPYRDALPLETVFEIIAKDAPKALDAQCFEALKCSTDSASAITRDLLKLALSVRTETVADEQTVGADRVGMTA